MCLADRLTISKDFFSTCFSFFLLHDASIFTCFHEIFPLTLTGNKDSSSHRLSCFSIFIRRHKWFLTWKWFHRNLRVKQAVKWIFLSINLRCFDDNLFKGKTLTALYWGHTRGQSAFVLICLFLFTISFHFKWWLLFSGTSKKICKHLYV